MTSPSKERSFGAASSSVGGRARAEEVGRVAHDLEVAQRRSSPAREGLARRALGQPPEGDREPQRGRKAQRCDRGRQQVRRAARHEQRLEDRGREHLERVAGREDDPRDALGPPRQQQLQQRAAGVVGDDREVGQARARAIRSAIRSTTPEGVSSDRSATGDRMRAERQRRHEAAPIGQQRDDRIPQRAVHERAVEKEHRRAVAARVTQFHPRTLSAAKRPAATMDRREAGSHPWLHRVDRHPGARRDRALARTRSRSSACPPAAPTSS